MQEKERIECYWICNIRGIGGASIRKLMQETKSVDEILKLSDQKLKLLLGEKRAECFRAGLEGKQRRTAEQRYVQMREKGIFFLSWWDESYPFRLKQINDAPVCLYGKGRLPDAERKVAAIVGARECSGYGSETAKYFAAGLAGKGVVIVSGMARGVDGVAQLAALETGGISVGVLGCGVDICYPPENRKLYDRLVKQGCLFSEYPPGTEPKASLFPPRNRIISGLSDMVLVTEAREKSGTLITVDMALEQGREVFAVPGRITDSLSCGCNRLIRNGAGMAVSVPQLWEELQGTHFLEENGMQSCPERKETSGEVGLRPLGRKIMNILDSDPVSLDEIRNRVMAAQDSHAELSVPELAEELVLLCMEGKAGKKAGMYFARGF